MTGHIIKPISAFVVLFMFMTCIGIHAQNSTSSPFSIFGIGEIETRDFGRTAGMGNIGIGFQDRNYLNHLNPAGLSGIDTLKFILDVSGSVKLSEFRTKTRKERTTDFNFKNLAVGFRATKWWTSSVGLGPFSNVGYNLKVSDEEKGTWPATYSDAFFSGSGGVNKFYWANSFEPIRGFSVGVTSSFLFGTITRSADEGGMTIQDDLSVNKIHFDFGAQYRRRFGQYVQVTAGGVYGYKSDLNIAHTHTVTSNSGQKLKDEVKPDIKSYIPESYGAGFSVMYDRTVEWVFGGDFRTHKWSADRSSHKALTYADSRIYSVGLQLTPNKRRPENYLQVMRFQLGACYNQSYLAVHKHQLNDYSVSFGVGMPFRNMSYINVAVNVGESRTGYKGDINERYVLLSVNLSLIEQWFAKRQWE